MAEGVLITGVYGAGKSSVAAEIAYLLQERRQPYALLDLDFLGWVRRSSSSSAGLGVPRQREQRLGAGVGRHHQAFVRGQPDAGEPLQC